MNELPLIGDGFFRSFEMKEFRHIQVDGKVGIFCAIELLRMHSPFVKDHTFNKRYLFQGLPSGNGAISKALA